MGRHVAQKSLQQQFQDHQKEQRGALLGTNPKPFKPKFQFPHRTKAKHVRPSSGNHQLVEPAVGPYQNADTIEQRMADKIFKKFTRVNAVMNHVYEKKGTTYSHG